MTPTSLHSDHDLLARIANDDAEAFQQLLARYQQIAYRITIHLLNDTFLAEDIVQEAFLKVWLRRKKMTEVENFGGWLRKVTSNLVYDHITRSKKEKEKIDALLKQLRVSDAVQAPATPEETEFERLVSEAVHNLPQRQRAVFERVKRNGYTRDEAAKELGISMETVKSHLELAIKSIRAYCMKRMDSLSATIIFTILF